MRVVDQIVTNVNINRHKSGFRPGVDGEMRFRQQHSAGNSVRFKLVKYVANCIQSGFFSQTEAQFAQIV